VKDLISSEIIPKMQKISETSFP
ncbi:uncharacterized protein METZ01_LOCUS171185, partial [marine metagenome]